MKKLIALLMVISVVMVMNVPIINAVPIDVNVTVPLLPPEMDIIILELNKETDDPWTDTLNKDGVSKMNFGPLIHKLDDGSGAGVHYSKTYFCAFIYATGFSEPYTITSSCSGLTSGGDSLPDASFVCEPYYEPKDEWRWPDNPGTPQNGPQSGSALGTVGSAVAQDKLIYRSPAVDSVSAIIQVYYALPTYKKGGVKPYPGWKGIPYDQPSGDYKGQVVLTITQ
ncbi:MAG: hypothetical protein ABH848_02470 [Candidatus Omnitrophota bacterium]